MIVAKTRFVWDRMKQSFDAKPFEWLFALVTLGWGMSLGNPIETFKLTPSYRVFANLMPEMTWAILCFYGGFARCVILTVNGSWFRSATLRTLASFSTLALWLAATIAFSLAGTSATGIYTHAIFFVIEFRCMLNAGFEAGRSERAEWARVFTVEAIQRYGRPALFLLFALGITRGAKRNVTAGDPL